MASDGKALENLVRTVEEFFLPQGCEVDVRKLVYGDTGAQLAELDIVVTGRLGTTELRWLIECRDRPSEGRAPTAWIEQLIGRKQIHGFNQVTAVSTTGFSEGASELASKMGIETRTVSDATAADVAGWFKATTEFHLRNEVAELQGAQLLPMEHETDQRTAALRARLASSDPTKDKLLHRSNTQDLASLPEAFATAVSQANLFLDILANDPVGKPVHLKADYPGDDHFVVDTELGAVRIRAIRFEGQLFVKESVVPLETLKKYTKDATGDVISQTVAFKPIDIPGRDPFSVEFHNIRETVQTHIVVRSEPSKRP